MGNQRFELDQQIRSYQDQETDPNQEEQVGLDYFDDNDPYYTTVPFRSTIRMNLDSLLQIMREISFELDFLHQDIQSEGYHFLAHDLAWTEPPSLTFEDLDLNEVQESSSAMSLKEFQMLFPIMKRLPKKDKEPNFSKYLKRLNQIASPRRARSSTLEISTS